MEYKLNVCHLYPDLLNLYGDTGNIKCLKKRMEWRGIECEVTNCSVGDVLDGLAHDIFFIGGGQDFEQEVLLKDADENKKDDIIAAIEDGRVFLAICGGYQILGSYYKTWDGKQYDFLGALDLYTVGSEERAIGNYMYTCDELDGYKIVGFENHSGRTFLGEGCRPIGKVLKGSGNNGQDGMEGCRYRNVFGCYTHGPILPKNPKFCDLLIEKALKNKYGDGISLADFGPIDDEMENNAHNYMVERLSRANSDDPSR
ncbi:MAG: type 1 glutamine amidotransferase [Anaerovoracaceae bacterium]|jgi:CobQ-like glutamine amidotransferase family enzyme